MHIYSAITASFDNIGVRSIPRAAKRMALLDGISFDEYLAAISLHNLRKFSQEIMVKIRLARFGSKKRPYYHVVVADHQRSRDGKFIEQLGTYDPNQPMTEARIDRERLQYWLSVGAELTTSLRKVYREHGKAPAPQS